MQKNNWILLDEKPSTVLVHGLPAVGEVVEVISDTNPAFGTAKRIGSTSESKDAFKADKAGSDIIYSAEI